MGQRRILWICLLSQLMLISAFLQICSPAIGLTELDWRLSSSKYAEGQVNNQTGFHGTSCADLTVLKKGTTVRAYIDLEEGMALEEIEGMSMWVNPKSGDGKIQIELLLDGDRSDSYKSKEPLDARIRSISQSWSALGLSHDQWNELDGSGLEYEKYGDKGFPSGTLEDFKRWMGDKKVVRIYITLYKDAKAPLTSALLDYVRIGDEVISFEPLEEEDMKDGPKSATSGGKITYTITYGNNELQPVDLLVIEDYDPRTVLISADPAPDPGTSNRWTFPALAPGAHGQIRIVMKTVKPAARADITGGVSGTGYASTRGMLSTDFESYIITNSVRILAGNASYSASVNTAIKPIVGSTLLYGEHGSGSYEAEEELGYRSASISAERSVLASQSACILNLSRRSIALVGSWSASVGTENDYRDLGWRDRYHEASQINLSYKTSLGKALSYIETTAEVNGTADRMAAWDDGFVDQRLVGNFTIEGEARWRFSSKKTNPTVDEKELDCGMETGEVDLGMG